MNAEDLKEVYNFGDRREVVEFVYNNGTLTRRACEEWVAFASSKLRSTYFSHWLVVLPEGRSRKALYAEEFGLFVLALSERYRKTSYVSTDDCVNFFYEFFGRGKRGRMFLPAELRDLPISVFKRQSDLRGYLNTLKVPKSRAA